MREEEFKAWLQARGARSEAGRNTRAYAVRTIENNIAALGSPHPDLDQAWNADRFEQLRHRLKELREELAAGGVNYRVLMPQSENPEKRLSSWRSWLAQYGQFLSGGPPGERDADRIRHHVLEHYIETARERDAETVDVLVRDVNQALGLNEAWPNICQAITGAKFLEMADVEPPKQIGANQSSATIFRFRLSEPANPDPDPDSAEAFVLFDALGEAFRPYSYSQQTGHSAYRIKPKGASNKADEAVEVDSIAEVASAMLIEGRPVRIQSFRGGSVNYLAYGKEKLVRYELDPAIAKQIGVPARGNVAAGPDTILHPETHNETTQHVAQPTNLILYGPPGTGKTYATAIEALRLCGEPVPEGREELMAAYRRLSDAGRIEFVTFHQSISYEDFVEGFRPISARDDAAGFELKQGVFRRIARRAETSTGPGDTQFSISGRQVFKMSIGEVANPEDAHLFEEAITGGYTLLGFEDIDWSDDRFVDRNAIIDAVRSKGSTEGGEPNAMSGRVQMPFIFRNWVKLGDIVIVSKGNNMFRAIGEISGDYEFVPREGGDYGHRRAVRWLWVDRAGAPVSEIYARSFSMKSIYLLTDADLNIPALERYIASQQHAGAGSPEPFVLIIDEIWRGRP